MKKRDAVVLGVLSVVVGFLYVSGLPMGLIPLTFADIDAGCIPNFFNVSLCLLPIPSTACPWGTPSLARILVEGLVTVFFAAFLEEVLLRGLMIRFFVHIFRNSKHGTLLAVLVSSTFFAIGHCPL